jgi:peptidyl-prolyl cis-trans isomerase A (cyclophilin A)
LTYGAFFLALAATSISARAQTPATPPAAPSAPPVTPQLPPDTAAPPPAAAPDAQLPDSPGAATPKTAIEPTGPLAVFDTTMGRLTCRLYDKQVPVTTTNFIGLATGTKDWTDPVTGQKVHGKPYYDGTTFHRVIPEFMIQGGDRRGDGTGDAGYSIDDEIVPGLNFDVPGRLAMANSGPNTDSTQFFITEVPYPDLDGKYTIFGQCDTHTVLMSATIARVDRDAKDKPLTPVTLNKLTIVRSGDPMPPRPAIVAAPDASATPGSAVPASSTSPPK